MLLPPKRLFLVQNSNHYVLKPKTLSDFVKPVYFKLIFRYIRRFV